MAYGIPSSLVSQPGHAAYYQSEQPREWNGKQYRFWNINNSVASWGKSYKSALGEMSYNFDSWVGIINIAKDMQLTDEQYFQLAQAIVDRLKEFPLPMYDLLKQFSDRMEAHQIAYNNLLQSLFTQQSQLTVKDNQDYFQAQAVKDIANYLLGKQENTDIASFSFDGEHALQLRLEGTFREHKTKFEYSINSSKDDPSKGDWIPVTDDRVDIDLTKVADHLNYDDDILIHALATARTPENIYTIDLLKPDNQDIAANKADTAQKTYIPSSEISVTTSLGGADKYPELSTLLDGNINSYWISNPDDEEKYLLYSFNSPILLSDFEYVVPTDFTSGRGNIVLAKLEVSLDGENYRVIEDEISLPFVKGKSTYSHHLATPAYAKYVKITPLQTHVAQDAYGRPVYYDRTHVSMYNFFQDSTAKIDLSLLDPLVSLDTDTFVYNNQDHQPTVTIRDYDDSTLRQGQDYTLSYESNRNAGTAKVKISAAGSRYQGEITRDFTINKAENPPELPADSYTAPDHATKLSDIILPENWNWENADRTLSPAETFTANALYADTNNYENTTKAVQISVLAKSPEIVDPVDPVDPHIPVDPVDPVDSIDPDNPVDPDDTEGPGNKDPGTGTNPDPTSPLPRVDTETPSTSADINQGTSTVGNVPSTTSTSRPTSTSDQAEATAINEEQDDGMVLYIIIGVVLAITLIVASIYAIIRKHRR